MFAWNTIELEFPLRIMTKPFLTKEDCALSSISLSATTAKSSQPSDSTSPSDVRDHPRLSSSLPFISHHAASEIPKDEPNLIETCPELLIAIPGSLEAMSSNPSQLKSPIAIPVPRFESLNEPTRILSANAPTPLAEP